MTSETKTDTASSSVGGATGDIGKNPKTCATKPRRCRRGFQKPAVAGNTGKSIIRQPKFEDKFEELKGQICDCSDARRPDVLTSTTKETAECMG